MQGGKQMLSTRISHMRRFVDTQLVCVSKFLVERPIITVTIGQAGDWESEEIARSLATELKHGSLGQAPCAPSVTALTELLPLECLVGRDRLIYAAAIQCDPETLRTVIK